jgi:hypothetical protein
VAQNDQTGGRTRPFLHARSDVAGEFARGFKSPRSPLLNRVSRRILRLPVASAQSREIGPVRFKHVGDDRIEVPSAAPRAFPKRYAGAARPTAAAKRGP